MDPAGHRFRADRWRSRGLVEPGARGRTARRQPVEAVSGRTRRDCSCGERVRDRILAKLPGGLLGPAIAAISLGLVGHATLAERLGRNQRFASAGILTTTAVMGAIGY